MVPNVLAAEPHVHSPGMGLGHYSSPRNPPSATQVMFAPQEKAYHIYKLITEKVASSILPNKERSQSSCLQAGARVLRNKILDIPKTLLAISRRIQ